MSVIYLDRNENNYGPAPKCLEVLKNVNLNQISGYSKAFERGVAVKVRRGVAEES